MATVQTLLEYCKTKFALQIQADIIDKNELTIEIKPEDLLSVAHQLRDDKDLRFEMLIDLCAVDYLYYGLSEWETEKATETGFSRGVLAEKQQEPIWPKPRFAVVYHLLSYTHQHRIRVKVFVAETELKVPSVIPIWNVANWYEREAFDLFGILFEGHPDLRRILTDYGFIGYPFRKDFPLIGQVEMRYSNADQRVIYEPVSIAPRTLMPKIIRDDHRYA